MSRAGGNPSSREETSLIASLADRALRRGGYTQLGDGRWARPESRGATVDRAAPDSPWHSRPACRVPKARGRGDVETTADSASTRGGSGLPCRFQLKHPQAFPQRTLARIGLEGHAHGEEQPSPQQEAGTSVARGSRRGSRTRLTVGYHFDGTRVQNCRRYPAGTRGRALGARARRGTGGAWPKFAGPEHRSFDPGPSRIVGFAVVRRLTREVLAKLGTGRHRDGRDSPTHIVKT